MTVGDDATIEEPDGDGAEALRQHVAVFAMLWAVFVSQAALGGSGFGHLIQVTLQSLTLAMTVRLGTLPRRVAIAGYSVAAVGLVAAVGGVLFDRIDGQVLAVSVVLIALAPFAIVRSIAHLRRISMATVIAALSLYVLLGLFFSAVYQLVFHFDSNAFVANSGELLPSTFQYLSLITLSTVGFGDVVAVSSLARTLVALEAILGQLFLVTVVALAVGNIGRSRASTRNEGR